MDLNVRSVLRSSSDVSLVRVTRVPKPTGAICPSAVVTSARSGARIQTPHASREARIPQQLEVLIGRHAARRQSAGSRFDLYVFRNTFAASQSESDGNSSRLDESAIGAANIGPMRRESPGLHSKVRTMYHVVYRGETPPSCSCVVTVRLTFAAGGSAFTRLTTYRLGLSARSSEWRSHVLHPMVRRAA